MRRIRLFRDENCAPWAVLLSISLGLCAAGTLFLNADFRLNHFKDRVVSVTVMHGINAAARVPFCLTLVSTFALVFFAVLALCAALNGWVSARIGGFRLTGERAAITLLSAISIVQIAARALTKMRVYGELLRIAYFGIALAMILVAVKAAARRLHRRDLFGLVSNPAINILALYLPLVFFFSVWAFRGAAFTFTRIHYACFILLWADFYLGYYWMRGAAGGSRARRRRIDRALFAASVPLLLIPISIPIANEVQFSLSGATALSPRGISASVVAALLCISLAAFLFSLRTERRCRLRPASIVRAYYFPLAIATVFLFVNHRHILALPRMDLYLHGDMLLPAHQLFRFGKLPFVDLWPAVGLSDTLAPILYACVNGCQGLDMLAWIWIPDLLGIVLIYFFLSAMTGPFFAFLFTALLPYEVVIPIYYGAALIPVLCLMKALRAPSRASFLLFWLSVLFVSLYRPSFGAAAIPAAAAATLCFCLGRKRDLLRRSAAAGIAVFGVALVVYGALLLLRGMPLVETFGMIAQYAKYDRLAGPLKTLAPDESPLVVWYYAGFPLICVGYLIVFAMKAARREELTPRWRLLAFLSVYTFIMSLRGLAQHCLNQEYFPYLTVFLLLYIPFLLPGFRRRLSRQLLFLGAFLLYSFAFPGYVGWNLFTYAQFTDPTLKESIGTFFTFRHWQSGEQRVSAPDDDPPYRALVGYLDAYLAPGQTFYQWICSAGLHVFSERELPGMFFLATDQYLGEIPQRFLVRRLDALHEAGRLPLAILHTAHRYGDRYWAGMDEPGIPWEVALYRVAEFIYARYRPMGDFMGYQLWSAKGSPPPFTPEEPRVLKTTVDRIQLRDMVQPEPGSMTFVAGGVDPYLYDFAILDDLPALTPDRNWWLQIHYSSSVAGPLQVFFGLERAGAGGKRDWPFSEEQSSWSQFLQTSPTGIQEVSVPIPLAGSSSRLTNLRLDPPNYSRITIHRVALVHSADALIPIDAVPQRFDLRRLPHAWGTYDEADAVRTTEVQAVLLSEPRLLRPEDALNLRFDGNLDRSSGNYLHFRLRARAGAVVTVSYGRGMQSTISFDVVPSGRVEEYLVRISCQWEWASGAVDSISVQTTAPIEVERVMIRKGD